MIIITGAAGFIGSAIVWQLNQEGINDILSWLTLLAVMKSGKTS